MIIISCRRIPKLSVLIHLIKIISISRVLLKVRLIYFWRLPLVYIRRHWGDRIISISSSRLVSLIIWKTSLPLVLWSCSRLSSWRWISEFHSIKSSLILLILLVFLHINLSSLFSILEAHTRFHIIESFFHFIDFMFCLFLRLRSSSIKMLTCFLHALKILFKSILFSLISSRLSLFTSRIFFLLLGAAFISSLGYS